MPQKPPPINLSPQVLKRDRLFRVIEGARAGAGLWVSGMAGSGKTTLIASYLRECRVPSLWYQLDERDGDLPSFFFHFGNALRKMSHRIYRSMPLLTAEYLPGAESFVSGYFAKLFSRIETPLWMVFDNCEEVLADSGFNLVLMSIFRFAPPGVVVVVISRDHPPPMMARMMARQKLTVIDSSELAFTESESSELIRRLTGSSVNEEDIRKIHSATGGWAAGIILFTLKPDQVERFKLSDGSRAPGEIFDFFGNEVFSKLEPNEQEFLLKTVLLPEVTPEIADALTENRHSEVILEKLIRRNFFLEKSFGSGSAYRYHPLFRDFLLAQFATRFEDQEARDVQKRAADVLAQAGKLEDAAPLYAKAGEWEILRNLIHQQADHLISQGRLRVLLTWIEYLPETLVQADAWLLFWRSIGRIPVSPEEGLASCRSAYHAFARIDDVKGCMVSLASILETSVWLSKPKSEVGAWIHEGEKYLQAVTSDLSRHPAGKLVGCMLAAIALFDPGYARLGQWEDLAHEYMRSSQDLDSSIAMSEWLLYLNCCRGELETARTLIDWATPILAKQEGSPFLLRWKIQQCHYHVAGSNADEGLLTAEQGLKLAEQFGIHQQDVALLGHKAYFHLLRGDVTGARHGLQHLARAIRPGAIAEAWFYNYLTCLEACTANDFQKAKELAALVVSSAEMYGTDWAVVSSLFLLSRIHQACGQPDPASECLAEVARIGKISRSSLVHAWVLLARADDALREGRPDDALSQAFQLAAQKGVLYHPAIGRRAMTDLCARALGSDIDPQSVLKYIQTLRLSPPDHAPGSKRWPWPVRAYLLGSFSILIRDEPLSFSRKAQARPLELFIRLACCGRKGETRENLADQLWPEAEGDKAEQALSTTLYRLRKLLGADESINQDNERIALSADYCWVDAWHFEDLVKLAGHTGDPEQQMLLMSEAVDLYRGNPADDKPLTQAYSEALQAKVVQALRTLGELHERTGDWQQAANCYRRGIVLAPLEEAFYRLLMNALGRQGNRTEAAAVYGRCRSTLEQHLGITPSKATTNLYHSIVAELK